MKKIMILLLVVSSSVFAETAKESAQNRMNKSQEKQNEYKTTLSIMNDDIIENTNRNKYNEYSSNLHNLEKELYAINESFKREQSVEKKSKLRDEYSKKSTDYSNLVNEFTKWIGSL